MRGEEFTQEPFRERGTGNCKAIFCELGCLFDTANTNAGTKHHGRCGERRHKRSCLLSSIPAVMCFSTSHIFQPIKHPRTRTTNPVLPPTVHGHRPQSDHDTTQPWHHVFVVNSVASLYHWHRVRNKTPSAPKIET